jgi:tetratricopeptide (TPR) repeat protein
MRPCLRLASVLGLLLTLAAAAPARAEDAVSAREHYQRGTSFYDLGKYAEAIREFEAAYEIKNDPALLYNLAQSHRLAGNSEQALHFYRTYLRYVPNAKNRAEIEGRIAQLEQLVAQKNSAQAERPIPPSTTPPAATTPPATTTPPAEATPPVPPPPAVTEPPPGAPPSMMEPVPAPPVLTAPAAPLGPPNDHHVMRRAGVITAAVGGAFLIVGAAFGTRAAGASNEINNEAAAGKPFDPSVESRGKSSQTTEAVFLTIGGLAAATGAVLYFYGQHLASREASVAPVATAQGGGLSLRVTF